ncbi:MAG: hypothetical protein HXY18_14850 [Bryobacteraceae bacterium]|nr:hypothetical protein [Bryobacteraceae bacterium]
MTRSAFLGLFAAAFQPEPAKPVHACFTDAEIHLIRDFFRPGGGNPPPSAQNREPLTPALAKQIRRGGILPSNLALSSFPAALARQLPPPPKDYERVLFHRWVLLMHASSRLIVDVVELVHRPVQPD